MVLKELMPLTDEVHYNRCMILEAKIDIGSYISVVKLLKGYCIHVELCVDQLWMNSF